MEKRETGKKRVVRAFSAGGVVFRRTDKGIEWLLINPKGGSRWQLPKGTIEKGEKSTQTALREVEEETGVKAKILGKLGNLQFFFVQNGDKVLKTDTFFLMEYEDGETKTLDGFVHEVEKVEWVETEEAIKRLTFKSEKEVLEKAVEKLS